MAAPRFYIQDAAKHDGESVVVRGWVYNKRSSGKIKFLVLRDGTGLMQGVLFKGECSDEAFEDFEKALKGNAKVQAEHEVYVHADQDLSYGVVVKVMAALSRNGGEKIGLVTDPLK